MTSVRISPKDREQKLREAQGYFAETFPRNAPAGTTAPTTGTVYFNAVFLYAGEIVTNILVDCGAAGSVMTLVKLGLYDKTAANRLAVSAESSASFAAAGSKTIAMLAAYTVPADDIYMTAYLGVATTVPGLRRAGGGIAASAGFGSGVGCSAIHTGQADLQTSHTLTFNNNNTLPMWVAVS